MAIGGSQQAPFTPERITSLRVWEIFLHFFSRSLSPHTCSLCLFDVHSAALGGFAGWIAPVKDDKTENRSAFLEQKQQWRWPVDGRKPDARERRADVRRFTPSSFHSTWRR